jgi:hypothetical protein
MGFEPMNTGFADQRVSHFATGAHFAPAASLLAKACPAFKKTDLRNLTHNKNPTSAHRAGGSLEFRFAWLLGLESIAPYTPAHGCGNSRDMSEWRAAFASKLNLAAFAEPAQHPQPSTLPIPVD